VTEAFAKFPEKIAEIEDVIGSYNNKLSKLGMADCILTQKMPSFWLLFLEIIAGILLLPLHIYGTFLNYIAYKIPIWLAAKIKDPNFRTSIQFGISVVLLPLYYILVITLFCLLTDEFVIKLVFAITLPFTGLFAFYNYRHMQKLWAKFRLYNLKQFKTLQYNELQNDRKHIIELIKSTINN
jgi:hypothetical protein